MATENFEAVIAANIRDFQRAMRDVDRQIRDAAMGANAPIDANISDFMNQMGRVDAQLAQIAGTHNINIDANTSSASSQITAVDNQLSNVAGNHNVGIDVNAAAAVAQVSMVNAQLSSVAGNHNVGINVNNASAVIQVAQVATAVQALTWRDHVVQIRTAWNNYQQVMGMMATFHRNMSEIMGITAGGIKIMISPAIIPILATIIGLLGQMGPLLGTVGGSTFALGSAFATAGIGAAAFGAIAVTNLKDVFGASSDLKKLQEKLDETTDLKKRAEILEKIKNTHESLNSEQARALESMQELKGTWLEIATGFESKTVDIFAKTMDTLGSVLKSLTPMFGSVMDAAGRLTDSLSKSVESESMKAFFDYLNTSAGPMLETITKSFGNFMKGFLSMMTAFGPLATETSNGFLKMSEGFAAWAAGLGESKKFQAFVDYVSENMPKIKSIFGDAITGIINTFAAFAPSSADMMTSLQDMMAKFKEWSTTLSENQGFQNFINYVKENGPRVVELIGNIVKTIVDFGVAFAPIGAVMLDMINNFLSWTTAMLENHPIIGKIMAAVVVLGGAMMAAMPHVVGLITVIQALQAPLIASTAKMVANSAIWVAKWVWMGVQSLLHAAKMAAAWLVALGPIGWVTAAIIGLAVLVIANWDKISEWTKKVWTAVSEFVSKSVTAIMGYIEKNFPAIFKVISQYMESAKEIISTVWDYVKGSFENTLKFLKSLVTGDFKGMKEAISDQMKLAKNTIENIWNAIKDFYGTVLKAIWKVVSSKFIEIVTDIRGKMTETKNAITDKWEEAKTATATKLAQLITSVIRFFSDVVTNVKGKMSDAVRTVGEKVGEMPGKVMGYAGDMLSAGKDLVHGLINGITGMAGEALNAITGVVDGVISKAKSLLKIKSPSRVFMGIGEFVSLGAANGIDAKAKIAIASVSDMATGITNAFNPQLAMPLTDMQMTPLDTTSQVESLKRQIKQELSVDMSVNHRGSTGTESSNASPVIVQLTYQGSGSEEDAMRMVSMVESELGSRMNSRMRRNGVKR